MGTYESNEVKRVIDAGPDIGDDFFRVQFHGRVSSKTLNITEGQLRRIAEILGNEAPRMI